MEIRGSKCAKEFRQHRIERSKNKASCSVVGGQMWMVVRVTLECKFPKRASAISVRCALDRPQFRFLAKFAALIVSTLLLEPACQGALNTRLKACSFKCMHLDVQDLGRSRLCFSYNECSWRPLLSIFLDV